MKSDFLIRSLLKSNFLIKKWIIFQIHVIKKKYNSRIPYEEAKKFVSFIFLQTYENIIDNNYYPQFLVNYENVPIVYLFLRQWLIVINNFRTKTKKRKNRRWKNNFPIVLLTIKLYFSIHSWKGWNWIFLIWNTIERNGTER